AIVSLVIGEWGTAVGLALLTLFNAWLGYHQEGKAHAAAAALGAMLKAVAKVRRDRSVVEIPAEEIVPGDIVLVDAGDRVPAHRAPAGRAEGGEDAPDQAGRPAHHLHHRRSALRVHRHPRHGTRAG